jgi:hypothetical protein
VRGYAFRLVYDQRAVHSRIGYREQVTGYRRWLVGGI